MKGEGIAVLHHSFAKLADTPGDPGNQLPYQESPPLLPGSYLIGISHFPDPGGLGLECDSPALSLLFTLKTKHNAGG